MFIDAYLLFQNRFISKGRLKTYAAISNAHLSRVWKRVKLSGSCRSTINGLGSTQLSDILCISVFGHFLGKLK